MPRSTKCRRVCAEPKSQVFKAESTNSECMIIYVEELESIRLVDYEGWEQGEAAERMEISRGTFQRILYEARKKVAEALIQGKSLVVQGGNYTVASKVCNTSKRCKHCRFFEEKQKIN